MSKRRKNIAGAEIVEAGLKNITAAAAREIAAAINKGGEELRDRAKRLAPVRTGELRRAIEMKPIRAEEKGRRFGVRIGVFPNENGKRAVYARYVEFGTSARRTGQVYRQRSGRRRRAKGTHPGTTGTPFLFPAYWSLRKRIRGRIRRAVNKAAKEAFRGGQPG